jgi:hypothetical protein
MRKDTAQKLLAGVMHFGGDGCTAREFAEVHCRDGEGELGDRARSVGGRLGQLRKRGFLTHSGLRGKFRLTEEGLRYAQNGAALAKPQQLVNPVQIPQEQQQYPPPSWILGADGNQWYWDGARYTHCYTVLGQFFSL